MSVRFTVNKEICFMPTFGYFYHFLRAFLAVFSQPFQGFVALFDLNITLLLSGVLSRRVRLARSARAKSVEDQYLNPPKMVWVLNNKIVDYHNGESIF